MVSLSQIELLLPELRAFAQAIGDTRDDAEDLVQDAIERALRAANPPGKLAELRPWLFRVIRNLHYDELRKRRVRREYLADAIRQSDISAAPTETERDVLLRQAFAKLSPERREILVLVDVLGLKYSETAEVLDLPAGTVMSRLSRARRALLALVNGDAPPDETSTTGKTTEDARSE